MKSKHQNSFPCHNCGGESKEISLFRKIRRVTSDARPWPNGGKLAVCKKCNLYQCIPNLSWKNDCEKIYKTYKIYKQADGAEQAVFSDNSPAPRSRLLVKWLGERLHLSKHGNILDVGCGNGGFLREFIKYFPNWNLYGTEYNDKDITALKKIPNFQKLFYGANHPPLSFFDLIVCVHVLEHVLEPSKFLYNISKFLKRNSPILIQVPDANANPFILTIADHASHFTKYSLHHTIQKTNLHVLVCPTTVIKRELSCIITTKNLTTPFRNKILEDQIATSIKKLYLFATKARRKCKNKKIQVFGSSIGATWLFNECKGRVKNFVDEDKFKINKTHLGKKIKRLQKNKFYKDSEIWVPIQEASVTKKLKVLGYKEVHTLN